jgi:hypothetical protein
LQYLQPSGPDRLAPSPLFVCCTSQYNQAPFAELINPQLKVDYVPFDLRGIVVGAPASFPPSSLAVAAP